MIADAHLLVFELLAALLLVAVVVLAVRRPRAAPPGVAPSAEMSALLRMWEMNLAQQPGQSDLSRVFERLALVEQSVGELRGAIAGIRDMVSRTETYVHTMFRSAVEHEQKGSD